MNAMVAIGWFFAYWASMFIGTTTLLYLGSLFNAGLNFKKASESMAKETGELIAIIFVITCVLAFAIALFNYTNR